MVVAIAALLAGLRSAAFIFWDLNFDADEAIFGLMAKHLSELRALPVQIYGGNYLLAVQAWLAVPLFWLIGPTVLALKLPLLVINMAAAALLVALLVREGRLRPLEALVASLFFVLAPLETSREFTSANGGNVEPLLYVLLLWMLRLRPIAFGIVLAIGFLHREFTAYGLIALLLIEAADRTLFTRENGRRKLMALLSFAGVMEVVNALKRFGDGYGPGTAHWWTPDTPGNVENLFGRFCWQLSTIPQGAYGLMTEHFPRLFGTRVGSAAELGLRSELAVGVPGLWVVLLLAVGLAVARVLWTSTAHRTWPWRPPLQFPAYLALVGLMAALAYGFGRCGSLGVLRYGLLAVFGATGIVALFLRIETARWLKPTVVVLTCVWATASLVGHVRLLDEYIRRPPPNPRRQIAEFLVDRGIQYGRTGYWTAYPVTFFSREKAIIASTDVVRIEPYQRIVNAHAAEAVSIAADPCPGGLTVAPGIYVCR
jgi:hypothetical protein